MRVKDMRANYLLSVLDEKLKEKTSGGTNLAQNALLKTITATTREMACTPRYRIAGRAYQLHLLLLLPDEGTMSQKSIAATIATSGKFPAASRMGISLEATFDQSQVAIRNTKSIISTPHISRFRNQQAPKMEVEEFRSQAGNPVQLFKKRGLSQSHVTSSFGQYVKAGIRSWIIMRRRVYTTTLLQFGGPILGREEDGSDANFE